VGPGTGEWGLVDRGRGGVERSERTTQPALRGNPRLSHARGAVIGPSGAHSQGRRNGGPRGLPVHRRSHGWPAHCQGQGGKARTAYVAARDTLVPYYRVETRHVAFPPSSSIREIARGR